MNIALKVHYRLAAIPVIRSFVMETAAYYGADSREVFELGMAAEEAAEHIITTYPAAEANAPFDIFCEEKEDALRFVFSNTGLPVNVDAIPEYDVGNPETSIDGLRFFLLEKLTDDFRFVNLGGGGWQTVIDKKLKCLKTYGADAAGDAGVGEQLPTPVGKLELSLAGPEDAYEITKLAYHTYRYSYAKKVFYYPEMLKEDLASRQVVSFILKNEQNEIVGHSAYLRSPYCREIAEAGGLMMKPDYRRSSGVMRLVKMQTSYPYQDDMGVVLIESNLVTAHTGSQRITKSFKFAPLALKISVHDRGRFIDMEGLSTSQRETLLYSVWAPHGLKDTVLYAPGAHAAMISSLLASPGLPVEVRMTVSGPGAGSGRLTVEKREEDQLAVVMVEKVGVNWQGDLKKMVRRLGVEGYLTIQLAFPAFNPLPAGLDDDLKSLGFFFSGILARTPENWLLLYTCLNNQEFDFSEIKLCEDIALTLRDYVRDCCESLE